MTYSVGLMKEAISGANSGNVIHNAVVLIVILVAFMAMTILLSVLKAKKAAKALGKGSPYQVKEA
jgi:uncharacterized phage infection (PIP) family protein YhgE